MGNNLSEVKFEDLSTYQSVIYKLFKRNKPLHLLMGNGFSIAYDYKIFSYNALYDFINELKDPILDKLFDIINTKNFEQVMRQLDNFIEIAEAFGAEKKLIQKLKKANKLLQASLIDAVGKLHPEHVFEINKSKSESCFNFLNQYIQKDGKIFSSNYDLLLYWVLMRNKPEAANDGFGRILLNPEEIKYGEEAEWSDELIWGKNKENQNIFYLHGALPFFDTNIEIEKEQYNTHNYLLENIQERMEQHEYPIFVTAGNGDEKLEHIMHNKYLTFCYESLCDIQGSLVVFGFNFGEYDDHIIDAINKAAKHGARSGEKLFSIYIGVYSESDLEHIKRIENKFHCKVNVYNSQTANIWS